MLDALIPKYKYNKTDYPNLEDRAVDMIIPERYGLKTNITPVCIDVAIPKYNLAKRAIKAIIAIRADGVTLTVDVDYTEVLANAEFTLKTTPKLSPNTTYYFVLEGDWTINGTEYFNVYGWLNAYAGGNAFKIDGAGTWTALANDLTFVVYGKNTIDGEEERKIQFTESDGASFAPVKLRDHTDRTKIAMSFKTPNDGQSFYITRIVPGGWKTASFPADKEMYMTIYSDQGSTQVGIKSKVYNCNFLMTNTNICPFRFPQRGVPSEILVDIEGYKNADESLMDNVADILEDVLVNIVGIPSGDLDSTAFAALKTARTQSINPQLDREITFNAFIEKLERGQLFKFMPTLEGKFSPRYYASGESSGTPHLRDEDFIENSFKCYRNLASVKRKYLIKYDENPTTQIYLEKEAISTIAEYIYKNKETLELETYLKDGADATQLTIDYRGLQEYPQREIGFEVSSYLFDKIPTDKVKITRTRGDNSGGTFDAVLFRILRLTKKQSTGTVVCGAVLDSQTY